MRYYIRVDHDSQKFVIDEVYDYTDYYEYEKKNKDTLVTSDDSDFLYFSSQYAAEHYLLETYNTEYLPDDLLTKGATRDFVKKAMK